MADTGEEDATIRNFRIVQKDYTIKGWVMDDERLKNIVPFTNKLFMFDFDKYMLEWEENAKK